MASACVNQMVDSSPSWFSPRISFSRDFALNHDPQSAKLEEFDDEGRVLNGDFEFRLDNPVKKMLPADELFSDGKLMPMPFTATTTAKLEEDDKKMDKKKKKKQEESGEDKILINDIFDKNFSPKAPKCGSRWREILGLKRSQKVEEQKSTSKSSSKSLKFFLHRNPKSDSASMNLPLLKDLDTETENEAEAEPVSVSSRLSLSSSSSSSCRDHEDLPRLSLDSDKPNLPRVKLTKPKSKAKAKPKPTSRTGRTVVRRTPDSNSSSRGVSVDSPRMNSSGKIVFHSLERSSSSPSSFNGGPRMKARGMERSYSANVRVRPVLNVPVCSLRGSSKSGSVFGFGQFFSSSVQKRDGGGGARNQSIKKNGSENNRLPMYLLIGGSSRTLF